MIRGRVFLVIAAIVVFLITVLSIYVWRQTAFNVLLGVGFLSLLVAHLLGTSRFEDTRADVDEALGGLDRVEAHLTGTEPDGTGRHADPEPPSYRSPTWAGDD